MMLVKALLTSTSFATGFEGGPIFQLIFMGGILGLALSEILTFIPQGGGGDCRNARMIINNKINKLRIAMKKSTKPIEGDILIIRIQALEWVQGRIQDLILNGIL
jgi:hypothetical protein